MKLKVKTISVIVCAALAQSAAAGPAGRFMCSSSAPYSFLQVVPEGNRAKILEGGTRTSIAELDGDVVRGQSIKAKSLDGPFIVPSMKLGKSVVDVIKNGAVVASVPGAIDDWDIATPSSGEVTYLTAYDASKRGPSGSVKGRQLVLNAVGDILGQREVDLFLDEEAAVVYRLTDDGRGVYQIPNELAPGSKIEVLSVETFLPITSVEFGDGVSVSSVHMITPTEGFLIVGSKLLSIQGAKVRPTSLAQTNFKAENLQVDPRSQRVLVNGEREFAVLDMQGNVLHRERITSDALITADARLGIDGSVAYSDSAANAVVVRDSKQSYKVRKVTTIGLENWNQVECFTARSSAFTVDGSPQLKVF